METFKMNNAAAVRMAFMHPNQLPFTHSEVGGGEEP